MRGGEAGELQPLGGTLHATKFKLELNWCFALVSSAASGLGVDTISRNKGRRKSKLRAILVSTIVKLPHYVKNYDDNVKNFEVKEEEEEESECHT